MLHPHPQTTSSVMISSNCPRLVEEFGDVLVHFSSPVWQLACDDQKYVLLKCEKHTYTCGTVLYGCDQWGVGRTLGNTALQFGLCTLCLSMQSCWAPNIPMVIRPMSGMRVKGKKKRCKLVPADALKAYCGSRGIATSILKLDTRWS